MHPHPNSPPWVLEASAGRNRRQYQRPLMLACALVHLLLPQPTTAQGVDIATLPSPATRKISFQNDIQPILDAACIRCHGQDRPKGGFRLTDRESVLQGSSAGTVLEVGNSANSPLIHYVAGLVEDMEMPPTGKGSPLSPQEIALLRAWIDQGLDWPDKDAQTSRELVVTPALTWTSVSGNERQFREHTGLREGWSGGLQNLYWREQLDRRTELTLTGRGLYNEEDYGLTLRARRRDLGSIEIGAEARREYDVDTGHYYAPYGPAPSLDRDLDSRRGRTWINLELRLPELPVIGIGYEYRWREGDLSNLSWGVAPGTSPTDPGKGIVPNSRRIHEETHLATLDVSYTTEGWLFEDMARVEFYNLESRKTLFGDGGAGVTGLYREDYDHIEASNVLRAEHQLLPWLFTSAGYLYANLQGDGSFEQNYPDFGFPGDAAPDITLRQESHTVNGNALLGSWEGLSLNGGLQAEWLKREGMAGLLAPFDQLSGNLNRRALDETATLKFESIPMTAIYATGRWQQEWIDQQEYQRWSDSPFAPIGFERDSEATGNRTQMGTGVDFTPFAWLTADTSYFHRRRTQDFDHNLDRDLTTPPTENANGYPAYILGRKVSGDEINTRVSWRITHRTKIALSYQYSDTDYRTRTASSTIEDYSDFQNPVTVLLPGGSLLAGQERAHTYSANLAIRPLSRLSLSGTVSYIDSHLDTTATDGVIIAPYNGQTVSVLTSGTYALTAKTHLRATYGFSHADYSQNELILGLPLGIEYERHTLNAALTHRITDAVSTTLAYGLFDYGEPTSNGANDYTAHAVTCALSYSWH